MKGKSGGAGNFFIRYISTNTKLFKMFEMNTIQSLLFTVSMV